MENIFENIKNFISKYIIYIIIAFVALVFILLLIPIDDSPKKNISKPIITLQGQYNLTIAKGEQYIEPGYTAYDEIDGNITHKVVVVGTVNSSVTGNYIINYKVTNSSNISFEISRNVTVIDKSYNLTFSSTYEPKTLTNGSVKIRINIDGTGFEYMITPDGKTFRTRTITYTVDNNDTYNFIIKSKDGKLIEKEVIISNIDKEKPTGSCLNTYANSNSTISVIASDNIGIKKYVYNVDNKKIESDKPNYSINKLVTNTSVTIYDNASNYTTINCKNKSNEWPKTITPVIYTGSAPKNYFQNLKFK